MNEKLETLLSRESSSLKSILFMLFPPSYLKVARTRRNSLSFRFHSAGALVLFSKVKILKAFFGSMLAG